MNLEALSSVVALGGILTIILLAIYAGATRAHRRGELSADGIRILRWAIVGQLAIYGLLAITAFIV
jgi:hypothetical protein